MALLKIFEFKGLHQAGKRMAVPLGYFRRFTNSYKDKTGRIVPIGKSFKNPNNALHWVGDQAGYDSVSAGNMVFSAPLFSQLFKGKIFQMLPGQSSTNPNYRASGFRYGQESDSEQFSELQNGTNNDVERGLLFNPDSMVLCPQGEYSSCVVNQKLYFCLYHDPNKFSDAAKALCLDTQVKSSLFRFDGLRLAKAGLPTPWSHYTVSNTGTAYRVRTVYMTIGLDGEVVMSNYLEHSISSTSDINLGNLTTLLAPVPDPVGNALTYFPTTRETRDTLDKGALAPNYAFGNYDLACIIIDATYTPTFLAGDGVSFKATYYQEQQHPGDWYMFYVQSPAMNNVYDAFYVKVTDMSGPGLIFKFSSKIKGFNGYTASWEDIDLDEAAPTGFTMATFLAALKNCYALSNTLMIMSVSANAAGTLDYQVAGIYPLVWDFYKVITNPTKSPMSFARPRFGIISSYMRDWYEHTVVKVQFPSTVRGITNYSNLLIGYDDNAIYFSDVSYGGSTEMTSGIANLIPPGSEFGPIRACCGSENFMLISRDRKNYILTGELTTGNVYYNECDVAVAGAANERAVSNSFADQIVFMNKTGIYSVNQAGTITEISKDIRDLFIYENIDGNLFNTQIFKDAKPDFDGGIFKICLDERRGFILFLTGQRDATTKAVQTSNILVYDTNDGSWYEWETPSACSSIEYVDGKIHYLCEGAIYVESLSLPNQTLTTSWITLGEPSLEKQVTQVKLFGKIDNPAPVLIMSQNSWNGDAYVTDDRIELPVVTSYIHKKRLTSSKATATSIIISCPVNRIYLEGIELEIEQVQQGMKQ